MHCICRGWRVQRSWHNQGVLTISMIPIAPNQAKPFASHLRSSIAAVPTLGEVRADSYAQGTCGGKQQESKGFPVHMCSKATQSSASRSSKRVRTVKAVRYRTADPYSTKYRSLCHRSDKLTLGNGLCKAILGKHLYVTYLP